MEVAMKLWPWKYLERHPQSHYTQLFVKGTRMRALSIYSMLVDVDPGDETTPEQIAADVHVPVEAVREAIAYVESDPPEIRADHQRETEHFQVWGVLDAEGNYLRGDLPNPCPQWPPQPSPQDRLEHIIAQVKLLDGAMTQGAWKYLEPHPMSNYEQLFIIGTRLRAEVIYAQVTDVDPADAPTPEEVAESMNLPVEAVREAIAYCESDPPGLLEDHRKQRENLQARGLMDAEGNYIRPPRRLSPEEEERLGLND
jgi:uncharacterized protein (DUF433 family)